MKTQFSFPVLTAAALAVMVPTHGTAEDHPKAFDAPAVFQAAGPTIASIQSTVDQYRAALGGINNGNNPGPLATGRREINWDGGGSTATSPGPTPFTVFLNTRGGQMTTPGTGFVQAPPEGLATTFANPTYATIFQPFSPVRLFSPVGSNETEVQFFLPGSSGATAATTRGFGVVFTDVDQPEGSLGRVFGSTFIAYYDARGDLIYFSVIPASPGSGSLSFLGILFEDARIASVKIRTGDARPGANDVRFRDIVMMDDFIYGEPQELVY